MRVIQSAVLFSAIFLCACGKESTGNDYCSQHKLYHPDHAYKVGSLDLTYTEDGMINAKLSIPDQALLGASSADNASVIQGAVHTIEDVDNIFSIEGGSRCQNLQSNVVRDDANLVAHYVFDCGSENRLQKVDIRLLEYLPQLDELVAEIDTPAVSKTFAISRQCEKPIYNY